MDPLKVRPRRDWCLLELEEREEKTLGGIVIPGELKEEKLSESSAKIISIGPGKKNAKIGLEPGLRVVFRGYLRYANEVPHDGDGKFFLVASDDIIGVIPPGTNVGAFNRPAMTSIPKGAFDAPVKDK